jgi:arsenate reductase
MTVEIYHNPSCSMSRNALRLIRSTGIEPHIIEYLNTPPTRLSLERLLARGNISAREILRSKETAFSELRLDNSALSDAELLQAIGAHPILMQRPIVVSPLGVNFCRPPELVLELLEHRPGGDVKREDGSDFLVDERVPYTPDVAAALVVAGLRDDALDETCVIYRIRTLAGAASGFAGFRLEGLRAQFSAVALPSTAHTNTRKNVMHLLLRRAYDLGAREMHADAGPADAFFADMGFRPHRSSSGSTRELSLQVS